MAAPTGNQNALGNKGGGRKTAYEELHTASLLKELWQDDHTAKDIQKKIKSGRYSIKDMFLYRAHFGDEKILREIFKKLVPDKIETLESFSMDDIRALVSNLPNAKKEKFYNTITELIAEAERIESAKEGGTTKSKKRSAN